MIYYKITPPDEATTGKLIKHLKSCFAWVRKNNGDIYCGTGNGHTTFIPQLAKDMGLVANEISKDEIRSLYPKEGVARVDAYITPCGIPMYDKVLLATHKKVCTKCKELQPDTQASRKRERKNRNRQSVTVAKLEPHEDLSVGGVLNSLKTIRSRYQSELEVFWKKLEQIDKVIEDMETIEESRKRLEELADEVKKGQRALRFW